MAAHKSPEHGDSVGLVEMAPELMHKMAFSGSLTFEDVTALSQTCRRMKSIFVDDAYGRDIHYALKGVVENVRAKRWRAAVYAVRRRWLEEKDGGEEGVWRAVVEAVVGANKVRVENENELKGWEDVVLACLSLPGAVGWMETWKSHYFWKVTSSVLHAAVYMRSVRVAQWMLEMGGEVDVRNHNNQTPFLIACILGCIDMVILLVEGGCDVEARDKNGQSGVFLASKKGREEVVAYLLQLGGVDVESRNDQQASPLSVACDEGHMGVVRLLVEEGGADVEGGEHLKVFPLYNACREGNEEIVEYLVEKGAWSRLEKDGEVWASGMIAAAREGHEGVVRMLLGMGVGVDAVDWRGSTALVDACEEGHVAVVKVLVEEGGANVNVAGSWGRTPLSFACEEGHTEVVEMLLAAGGDPMGGAMGGATPLEMARIAGRVDIIDMLEQVLEGGGGDE